MSINLRYFASLKEVVGRPEDSLAYTDTLTVNEVWKRVNPDKSLPGNTLVAVNMEYVDFDFIVKDGDEVAFFPPVTGG
jgi:sulfur-carrier protein